MENRKAVDVPKDDAPAKTKPDDFEPKTTSNGQGVVDDPVPPPPPAFDCVSPLPDNPPDSAEK